MYRVDCSSCGKPFDAEKAQDCNCLQPMRSVRCPNCAACFCNNQKKLDAFWRDVPSELRQRRRSAPEPAAQQSELKRPLVLFADDDATGRAIATRVIQAIGFGVIVAADGEEGLALAREHRPELIITDALMPRRDGRDMARIIKAERPATKIIVITSVYKDPRYKHEAFRDFAVDAYLAKPINPAQLRELVMRYLSSADRA
ncbi:MAG TPA: response regulator [Thermoanaerobaculia bacterium]|jgi:CheY-like chemotaxis protein